jgi:hypothetical protein
VWGVFFLPIKQTRIREAKLAKNIFYKAEKDFFVGFEFLIRVKERQVYLTYG